MMQQAVPQALTQMGVDGGEATPIVNSILDWIDVDDQPRIQGAESEYYRNLSPPYMAKNGPIDDITELLLIKGVTPEIYYGIAAANYQPSYFDHQRTRFGQPGAMPGTTLGLKDMFTPLSDGKINLNTATNEVLQLIPGVDAPTAEAIVAGRSGTDDGSGMFGPYNNMGQVLQRVPTLPQVGPVINALTQYGEFRSRTFQVGWSRTLVATPVPFVPSSGATIRATCSSSPSIGSNPPAPAWGCRWPWPLRAAGTAPFSNLTPG
jgi:type II secretory pathway component PulK